jgi:hypothetical protein
VPARYLPIYLNDHLAGATLGVELAHRTARENREGELGEVLRRLETQLVEDRDALVALIERLGLQRSRPKVAAAWTAEKLGRLKPNGHAARYSPLSRLLELEGLAAGIDAKLALWLSLREIADRDGRLGGAELERLIERARDQRERLEPHRLAAARVALG